MSDEQLIDTILVTDKKDTKNCTVSNLYNVDLYPGQILEIYVYSCRTFSGGHPPIELILSNNISFIGDVPTIYNETYYNDPSYFNGTKYAKSAVNTIYPPIKNVKDGPSRFGLMPLQNNKGTNENYVALVSYERPDHGFGTFRMDIKLIVPRVYIKPPKECKFTYNKTTGVLGPDDLCKMQYVVVPFIPGTYSILRVLQRGGGGQKAFTDGGNLTVYSSSTTNSFDPFLDGSVLRKIGEYIQPSGARNEDPYSQNSSLMYTSGLASGMWPAVLVPLTASVKSCASPRLTVTDYDLEAATIFLYLTMANIAANFVYIGHMMLSCSTNSGSFKYSDHDFTGNVSMVCKVSDSHSSPNFPTNQTLHPEVLAARGYFNVVENIQSDPTPIVPGDWYICPVPNNNKDSFESDNFLEEGLSFDMSAKDESLSSDFL